MADPVRRMSLSAQKPSKTRRRKTTVGARPAAKIAMSEGGELTPIERLLDLMNDEKLSRMQQLVIAKDLAPYFHPKPKPIPPEQLAYSFLPDHQTGDENAESAAQQRERMRKNLFRRFD
jgi:hypothetical protein